jgi:hypothetical protein
MTATMRQVPIIEKKDRVKKRDSDWYDAKMKNPGQLGKSKEFMETKHQTIASLKPDNYVRSWNIKKPKKKVKKVRKPD